MRFGITSIIYASIASSMVMKARFVHSLRYLSRKSSAIIPELTTSSCSILQIVWTNALVIKGGFPQWAARNLSLCPLHIPTVHYTVSWRPFTVIWWFPHPFPCWSLHLLLPDWQTIVKCVSWVIFSVAALAASQWMNCCPGCSCVSASEALDDEPVDLLDSNPLPPGWGVCVAMSGRCGIGEEDDHKKKWDVLKNI